MSPLTLPPSINFVVSNELSEAVALARGTYQSDDAPDRSEFLPAVESIEVIKEEVVAAAQELSITRLAVQYYPYDYENLDRDLFDDLYVPSNCKAITVIDPNETIVLSMRKIARQNLRTAIILCFVNDVPEEVRELSDETMELINRHNQQMNRLIIDYPQYDRAEIIDTYTKALCYKPD